MDYLCPVCNKNLLRELSVIIPHTEEHIMELIKKDHPDWIEDDGICRKCYEYYKKQLHPK